MLYPPGASEKFKKLQDRLAQLLGPEVAEQAAIEMWTFLDPVRAEQQIASMIEHTLEWLPSRRPTWSETVNASSGRERKPPPPPGFVHQQLPGKYLEGRFYKMPNMLADDLLATMPGLLLKGYVYSHRLANINGIFWCSADTMAQKIGSRDVRVGQRVFARLIEAGLLVHLFRGNNLTGRANIYQIVPLETLDRDRVLSIVKKPLKPGRRQGEEAA